MTTKKTTKKAAARQKQTIGNMEIWVSKPKAGERVIFLTEDAKNPVGMIKLYKSKAELYSYSIISDPDESNVLFGGYAMIGTYSDYILAAEVLLGRINAEFRSGYARETIMSVTTKNYTIRMDSVRGGFELWKDDRFIARSSIANEIREEFLKQIGMNFFYQPREMHLVTEGVARQREVEAGRLYESRGDQKIAELKTMIESDNNTIAELRMIRTMLEKEVDTLEMKHQGMFDEHRSLKRSLRIAKDERDALLDKNRFMESALEDAKKVAHDNLYTIGRLEAKLEEVGDENQRLLKRLNGLDIENAGLKRQAETLRGDVALLEYKLQKADSKAEAQKPKAPRYVYCFPVGSWDLMDIYRKYENNPEMGEKTMGDEQGMYTFANGVHVVAHDSFDQFVETGVIDINRYFLLTVY